MDFTEFPFINVRKFFGNTNKKISIPHIRLCYIFNEKYLYIYLFYWSLVHGGLKLPHISLHLGHKKSRNYFMKNTKWIWFHSSNGIYLEFSKKEIEFPWIICVYRPMFANVFFVQTSISLFKAGFCVFVIVVKFHMDFLSNKNWILFCSQKENMKILLARWKQPLIC